MESRISFVKRNISWWQLQRPYYKENKSWPKVLEAVREFDIDNKIIGEIGVGPYGGILYWAKLKATKIYFIDYIMDELRALNFIEWPENCIFVNSPAEKIDLPNKCMDLLISFNCLDHGWDIKKAILECIRVSRNCVLFFDCKNKNQNVDHNQVISFRRAVEIVNEIEGATIERVEINSRFPTAKLTFKEA